MASVAPTILLVDDDEDLRDALSDLLALRGHGTCLGVGSLADARAQAARVLACSLAILDINLGEGAPSGVDVHRWLVEVGFSGRIVFLTGYGSDDPRVRDATRLGLQILTKPIGVDRLYALTAAATGSHAP
jgi:DNA-binding response OmpR family regulator